MGRLNLPVQPRVPGPLARLDLLKVCLRDTTRAPWEAKLQQVSYLRTVPLVFHSRDGFSGSEDLGSFLWIALR